MLGFKAQLDVLESCASALSNEGSSAGGAADELGGAQVSGNIAGTTPASAELVAALSKATEHWRAELDEAARLLEALGSAIDHDAVALANLDADNAEVFNSARNGAR